MKDSRVIEIAKEIKCKGVWGKVWGNLEPKKGFQRQPVTKFLRLTLVFMRSSALQEKFNFFFSRDFC